MADYFQDIVPPGEGEERPEPRISRPQRDEDVQRIPIRTDHGARSRDGMRSIRDISAPPRSRMTDMRGAPPFPRRPRSRRGSRLLWGIAGVCALALGGLLLLSLRGTVITIIPKSELVTFNETSRFTAYPEATAPTSALAYTVQTIDVDESEVVPSTGTTHAESKASGTITAVNAYSDKPVRIIKNSRFQTADGLIFRVPADILIPAKKGATPGTINVSVIADQPGEKYNIGPSRFTLPGLKSNAKAYAGVYGVSKSAMTGGYSGNAPGVDPTTADAARARMYERIQAKANDASKNADPGVVAVPAQIGYEATVVPEGSNVRMKIRARIALVTMPQDQFAQAVAQAAGLDTGGVKVSLTDKKFGLSNEATSTSIGTDPLHLIAAGSVRVVWAIDEKTITAALASQRTDSFERIIAGFPSIQEARARIEPFWKKTFPSDPTGIKVRIAAPAASS